MARGWRFDLPETVEKAKNAWLIEANPLPAFIDARCEPKGACWLADLYNEFLSWAKGNGITRPQQKSTFKRNLQSSGFVIDHGNGATRSRALASADRRPRSWPLVFCCSCSVTKVTGTNIND